MADGSKFSSVLQLTDLNDFIAPSQACVKPIKQDNQVGIHEKKKVEITLGDCLACSGCITSAETVLISKQSYLDLYDALEKKKIDNSRLVVISLSHQAIASIGARFDLSFQEAAEKLSSLFHQIGVDYVFDLTFARHLSLIESQKEFTKRKQNRQFTLSSICPGFVCYVEKTHGDLLVPYLSQVKSPQQIMGSLIKKVWTQLINFNISPSSIYHCTVMPCFDKKLEASRVEFTNEDGSTDVDCVLTPIEIESLLEKEGIKLAKLPNHKLDFLHPLLIPSSGKLTTHSGNGSGGWSENILRYAATIFCNQPNLKVSDLKIESKRNKDFLEVTLSDQNITGGDEPKKLTFAIVNGFRNIQTLIQRIKRKTFNYDYVEVMACPSGCLNGGGMIRGDSVEDKLFDKVAHLYSSLEFYNLPLDDNDELIKSLYNEWFTDETTKQQLFYTTFKAIPKTDNLLNVKW